VSDEEFYRREPGPLSQGDIVLAPFVRVLAADNNPPASGGRADDDAPRLTFDGLGDGLLVVKLTACVVVSHDCHLDKEFNRAVTRLHSDGVRLRQAREQAEGDRTLDRWIVVSPILTPDEVRSDLAAVQRGEVVGSFYLPHHDALGGGGVADLAVKATVDRLLCRRAAGLTEPAADQMRIALMRTDLARRPIGLSDLEHALGAKLIEVSVDAAAPIRATLRFANGETLDVTRPPHAGAVGGSARTERSAP